MTDYYLKYLKYKQKYTNLKQQLGGEKPNQSKLLTDKYIQICGDDKECKQYIQDCNNYPDTYYKCIVTPYIQKQICDSTDKKCKTEILNDIDACNKYTKINLNNCDPVSNDCSNRITNMEICARNSYKLFDTYHQIPLPKETSPKPEMTPKSKKIPENEKIIKPGIPLKQNPLYESQENPYAKLKKNQDEMTNNKLYAQLNKKQDGTTYENIKILQGPEYEVLPSKNDELYVYEEPPRNLTGQTYVLMTNPQSSST
jgi:hypothetical protein